MASAHPPTSVFCVYTAFVAFLGLGLILLNSAELVDGQSILCPDGCSCLGELVDCSQQKLSAIPGPIHSWVTILHFQGNKITTIPDDAFAGLINLKEFLSSSSLRNTLLQLFPRFNQAAFVLLNDKMSSMVIYTLSTPKPRGLYNIAFYGLDQGLDTHECTIYGSKSKPGSLLGNKFSIHKFYKIKNAMVTTRDGSRYLKLTEDSKVFQTGDNFDVPQQTIRDFETPAFRSIPEALVSPKKRKLSVSGNISQVYELKKGDTWRRRDIVIEDEPTSKKICVKLWGPMADTVQTSHIGHQIELQCVEVDEYNSKKQLKTIDVSRVQVTQVQAPAAAPPTTANYIIEGVDVEEDTLTLCTACNKEFTMPTEMLEPLGYTTDGFIEATPMTMKLTVTDNVVTEITDPDN